VQPIDLHHVALATRDAGAPLGPLVGELGGVVMMGGENLGFRSYQVRLGDAVDGMTVELLEPWHPERFDFLERFVARHGAGPHHLTFKVADLAATLDRVRTSGYTPVGVSLEDPRWKEAFLQPREAHGTVVQLAQAASPFPDFTAEFEHTRTNGSHGDPVWWPDPPTPAPTTTILRRVVMTTPNVDAALGFFAGLLGGTVDAGGETPAGRAWTELRWPGSGRIRLEEDRDATPGVARLELVGAGPDRELDVAGTRLVVQDAGRNAEADQSSR
jgi:catechol 2,3-dioxygenase-like lactoylglutathione lyase family enzyme